MRLSPISISVLACLLALLCRFAAANDEQIAFFEKKIRPVLVEHCYKCHSADAKKKRGGLLLDSKDAIRKGGESGPGIVPGEPDESLVLGALQYDSFEMPPSGKLDDRVIADFERWIQLGAHDPRTANTIEETSESIDVEAGKQFWSFQPIAGVQPPSVEDSVWPESAVDLFLQARLEAEGITHVPDADRYTLVRRVYYDLVGLPPTPQQIRDFVDDQSSTDEAMAKLVDRLLESKQFGERWGRHWLDVVRFAESSGGGRTLLFPDAWRYRDYVIDAFNDDMPFDQFLREQIAGDLLPAADRMTRWRQLTGVGFLMLGPTNYELQDKDILEMDIVDEQLDTIGKAFMGMTVGCARCHDHKFDPIPMRDYYAMAGILKSTNCVIHSNVSAWNRVDLPVDDELASKLEEHQAKLSSLQKELKTSQQQLKDAKSKLGTPIGQLAGIVVDDEAAQKKGKWIGSTHVKPFIAEGYVHDDGARDATCSIRFPAKVSSGRYEVRVFYTAGENRSRRVPVIVRHANGKSKHFIDQTKRAKPPSFVSLGEFEFSADEGEEQSVTLSNAGATVGVVIADAVQYLPVTEFGKSDSAAKMPKSAVAVVKSASATKLDSTKKSGLARNDSDANLEQLESRIQKLQTRVKKLKAGGPKRPKAMAPSDKAETGDIHLAIRGVVANQGPLIPRGVLQVALNRAQPDIGDEESGRLQLADWIVDRSNPLTARVAVNRVWYWLFGVGLVRTVDNFGEMGERPSHPELLDFLANAFIEDGWSVKRLIRRIVLSHTYRLSSQANAGIAQLGSERDPSNRLLWRMNRRRLDAESIRDSILSVAGSLDLTMGGSNIKSGTAIEYDYVFDSRRRSVYLPVFRNTLPQLFATFDFADPNIQGGSRTASTIAPQALLLMNDPFVIEQTRIAAKSLIQDEDIADGGSTGLDQRIESSYLQVVGRLPSDDERRLAARFIADDRDGDRYALLYQTLFQSLKFRYVD